jgi:hypothetical protein
MAARRNQNVTSSTMEERDEVAWVEWAAKATAVVEQRLLVDLPVVFGELP